MKVIYPSKILLAWSESIKGNKQITDWLIKNGYPELGMFYFAVRNDQKAKKWYIANNHPILLALINGAEGNEKAQQWLKKGGFDILYQVAKAADNEDKSIQWLKKNGHVEFSIIAHSIKIIKNQIEMRNNDIHNIQF